MSSTSLKSTNSYEELYDLEFAVPFDLKSIHLVNQEQMSINLRDLISGFQIYESIQDKFISGEVVFVDGVNLPKLFRFTGQEYIRISMTDGREDSPLHDMTFRVSKQTNQVRNDVGILQGYKLNIEDPSLIKAYTKRISKVFRGKQSDMLKNILLKGSENDKNTLGLSEEDLGIWQDTESDNNQFICPNWTIMSAIAHFIEEADYSTDSLWRNGMFFYQTFDGKFNLKSIDEMCNTNEDDIQHFVYKPHSGGLDSLDSDKKQILEVSKPISFNTIRGTISGMYASKSETYDPITGVVKENVYDIEETIGRGKSPHVTNQGAPILRTLSTLRVGEELGLSTKDVESGMDTPEVIQVPKWNNEAPNKQKDNLVLYNHNHNHDFDDNKDFTSNDVFVGDKVTNNSKLERLALKELLKQEIISIILPIRTDVSVGNVIQLAIPEPEIQDEKSDTKDTINDNRYLVINKCITVNNAKHKGSLHLECVKETFSEITEEKLTRIKEKASAPYEIGLA